MESERFLMSKDRNGSAKGKNEKIGSPKIKLKWREINLGRQDEERLLCRSQGEGEGPAEGKKGINDSI